MADEMNVPPELGSAAERILSAGLSETVSVRDLVSWFGFQKRGKQVVAQVRSAVAKVGLMTWPDFRVIHFDGVIELRPAGQSATPSPSLEQTFLPSADDQADCDLETEDEDPVPRLALLSAANRRPVSVTRDASIAEVVTILMQNDFSQVPVMQGDRNPDGFVSWATLGMKQACGVRMHRVREIMNPRVPVLRADTPLFHAVQTIASQGFVLVEGVGRMITGLVTTSDISLQFDSLARPFLLVSQIEGHLRALVSRAFTAEELLAAKDPADQGRKIAGASDLAFGEHVRLLECPRRWEKLGLPFDRRLFIERLKRIREIRNDIMHFDPDPLEAEAIELLHLTSEFLETIAKSVRVGSEAATIADELQPAAS